MHVSFCMTLIWSNPTIIKWLIKSIASKINAIVGISVLHRIELIEIGVISDSCYTRNDSVRPLSLQRTIFNIFFTGYRSWMNTSTFNLCCAHQHIRSIWVLLAFLFISHTAWNCSCVNNISHLKVCFCAPLCGNQIEIRWNCD